VRGALDLSMTEGQPTWLRPLNDEGFAFVAGVHDECEAINEGAKPNWFVQGLPIFRI
jgi:hypothetical protein